MKFPLPELMYRYRHSGKPLKPGIPGGDSNADLTHCSCREGDTANGVAAIGSGNRHVTASAETRGPTHYRTSPRLRSKKKRFG
ncbi:hypothetical protein SAMN05216386_2003 [Nitrosospira briensis]|uniref:Uncharacterized protein n=1 Tax=Nitrosospira briensis TaxID=35799 RepID=A0A1I5C919_9PROT|nr:hypothetical protein SAMN05216386_2003 [Nitrosospira briensis]SFO39924.1 hypothetical protein SAMN05216332_11391 [Nitrosospira briensis]